MTVHRDGKAGKERNRNTDRISKLPRVNLRPFLFLALGQIFGILLYSGIRFHGFRAFELAVFLLLAALSFRPFSFRRAAVIFLCFFLAAGAGAGLFHVYTENYISGAERGNYTVSGTVTGLTIEEGAANAVLAGLSLDGVSYDGKMTLVIRDDSVRPGDRLTFSAYVSRNSLPQDGDSYRKSLFVKNIRYAASAPEAFEKHVSADIFLRLNALMYDSLHNNLPKTQASTAYALLTGNSGSLDDSFSTAVRQGGAAHIFAVSGLHIGILYGAVSFLFRRLKRYKVIPASAAALFYTAFCGFSVSSVRAVLMSTALGVLNATGKKYDFPSAISFSSFLILLFRPAEWLSAGFRLSFGACLGLALFSGRSRKRRRFSPLLDYLTASLAVQAITFPILLDTFGYFSVWGILLNLFLIPALPVLFLGLFVSAVLSLVIPPAAFLFMAVPNGMLSLFLWIFSFDFSFVLKGFALGAGGTVWLSGCIVLSRRVRFRKKTKLIAAPLIALLFFTIVILKNFVFFGCKLTVSKDAVLVKTKDETVLIIEGNRSVKTYREFLSRNYGGTLDGVVILGDNTQKALSAALFLSADEIRVPEEIASGLRETKVIAGKTFSYGSVYFQYESDTKLTLFCEGTVTEIDFSQEEALKADLFLTGEKEAEFFLTDGKIYALP